jgi:hypothetical protein
MPYQVRNATPSHRTTSMTHSAWRITVPMPATPATISTRSETAQIATTGATCSRAKPCRSTNAFCAPIAMISDRPVSKPATAESSTRPR